MRDRKSHTIADERIATIHCLPITGRRVASISYRHGPEGKVDMESGMSPPGGVTAATATRSTVAVATAAVLLTRAPSCRPEAGAEGLVQLDELLHCPDSQCLQPEEIVEVWQKIAAAVVDRNAQIRTVRAAARRLDNAAVTIPVPLNIVDHNLSRIATWCRHTDIQLHEVRRLLDSAAETRDMTFASAYVDALDTPAFAAVFSESDLATVYRLRRVVDGDGVLDDELRRDAERLRQRASTIATQEFVRLHAQESLTELGYQIIDTFGTRAAGLDLLTLSHPAWSDHVATVVIGSEEIGGKMLRTSDVAGVEEITADDELDEAFQEDMRRVGAVLRCVGVRNEA